MTLVNGLFNNCFKFIIKIEIQLHVEYYLICEVVFMERKRILLKDRNSFRLLREIKLFRFVSENINLMSSRQDHVFVPVGETTEVNIDAYQFNTLRNCSNTENYSATEVSLLIRRG